MKFIVDENLPPRLKGFLQRRGHEAAHVTDLALGGAEDCGIAELACRSVARG
jgi:predicted nuclease of predicted toxin-antitoxin system